jgi:hypothetical protein
MIERGIPGDGQKPGEEMRLLRTPPEIAVDLDKDFLGNVSGIIRIENIVESQPEDTTLILPDKALPSQVVSRSASFKEFRKFHGRSGSFR